MDLCIKHGTIVTSEHTQRSDVLISGGKISQVAETIDPSLLDDQVRIIDASGLLVFPGLIDAHTHYHLVSRGTVTADSFQEGSRLAAFGGVSTVIDFADHDKTRPLIDSLTDRSAAMAAEMAIDFTLHQGVYGMSEQIPEQLKAVREAGVHTIKIFTTYRDVGYLIETDGLRALFTACRDLELMVTVHAEDDGLIEELLLSHGDQPFTPAAHALLRPAEAEERAIRYIGGLAGELGMPVYIVHLSSEAGLKAIGELRVKGIQISTETTPHYLQLTNELLDREDAPLYIMTPPLRSAQDNRALWKGVSQGAISIIATDHCTFTHEQKLSSHDCRTIYPGIPGTEEMLPLIHTFGVEKGLISMEKLVALLSVNPAKMFGIYPQKGSLIKGTDADITLFDPSIQWTITNASQHTAAGYTPYDGTEVKGKAVMTIRRGEILTEGDTYHGVPGSGRFVRAGRPGIYHRHTR
jgi:dihydropyrimidinase